MNECQHCDCYRSFSADMHKWQREFAKDVDRFKETGNIRITPGMPLMQEYFNGASSEPANTASRVANISTSP